MIDVTIFHNPLEMEAGETTTGVTDIHGFLASQWSELPKNARLYHANIASSCDVTPNDAAGIERLGQLSGNLYIVVYPEGFVVIALIIAVVLSAVAIGLSFLLRPSPQPDRSASPNNSLSDRQNQNRPNQRIPDIVGNVRATPDLIAVTYRIFESNQEIEVFYGCIGKGKYEIGVTRGVGGGTFTNGPVVLDIKEDTTPDQQIAGSSVEIYGPGTSPNSGDQPQLRIGAPINTPVVNLTACNAVNGQLLRPPNDTHVNGNNDTRAVSDGSIETNNSNIDYTALFGVGDRCLLVFSGAVDSGGYATQNLTGSYIVLSVSTSKIVFTDPAAVNSNWANLVHFVGGASEYQSPNISETGSRVVGPFVINVGNLTEVWANFVNPNGLYKVSGSSGAQYAINTTINMIVQCLDADFNRVGGSLTYSGTINGSAINTAQRAVTIKAVLPTRSDGSPAGIVQVSAVRVSDTDPTWQGTNADSTQWRDLYGVAPIGVANFGNVTTVQTSAYATASALTVKSRKLNMAVTRMIPTRVMIAGVPTYVPNTNYAPSTNAADIIMWLALDPFIGNRQLSEMDVDEIYDVLGPSTTQQRTTMFAGGIGQTVGGPLAATVTGDYFLSPMMPVTPGDVLHIGLADAGVGDSYLSSGTIGIEFFDSSFAPSAGDFLSFPFSADQQVVVPSTPVGVNVPVFVRLCGSAALVNTQTLSSVTQVATPSQISTYFGTDLCSQFCYTFDDDQVSFEEAISYIMQATFCTAFRRGSIMSVQLEKQTANSVLLFNHRNKIPKSETRTVTFGTTNDYDGVELNYIDPAAPNYPDIETTVTLYFPVDQSAVNPRKITAYGVRNLVQAKTLGWRIYNKLLYQNTAVEFKSTQEAALLVLQSRILVADNTRPDTQDGQVVSQSGLTLTLSQPVTSTATSQIFLQMSDGTVDSMTCTPVAPNMVILSRAPALALVTDPSMFAQTTYMIVAIPTLETIPSAFLLAEKQPEDGMQYTVKAVNYDDRYYARDGDFIAGTLVLASTSVSSAGFIGSGGGTTTGGGSAAVLTVNGSQAAGINEDGNPYPYFDATDVTVTDGGMSYPSTTKAVLSGNTPTFLSGIGQTIPLYLTIVGGVITGATFDGGYQWDAAPEVVFI